VKHGAALLVMLAALVPGTACAQGPGVTKLAGRIPQEAVPAIDSLIAAAVAESLPTEPLVQKALEGSAKGIPAEGLVNGVRRALLQLREARVLVGRALPGKPQPEGHVAAVAAALARGLPPSIAGRMLTMAPDEPPAPALHAAADLVAHRFNPDSAADLLVAAHSMGLRGERLLDVASAADQELQRGGGRTQSDALARVRAMLPNVPAPKVAVTPHGKTGS
jgi:hypothetical protein